jgi:hypothetical protein
LKITHIAGPGEVPGEVTKISVKFIHYTKQTFDVIKGTERQHLFGLP